MKQPLAYRLRPKTLDDIIGQDHLVGENQVIRRCIGSNNIFSMIFFGEPGTGKTTMATVIANELNIPYRMFNAVIGNKKDLTTIFEEAKLSGNLILIVEEIHRLNKDKQDLLLPHVESGLVIMIGTTTSNPYFSINPAIRSRCHLFEIHSLSESDIAVDLDRAIAHPEWQFPNIVIDDNAKELIAKFSNGDLRYALNILELAAVAATDNTITVELIRQYAKFPNMNMDHDGDGHYDALSAFQKSIRGSDVDAALYYLGRLILANDMDSIERRLLVTAYEDIGLANPAAVARTISAIDAAKRIGFPEAVIPLGVAVIDLTLSPKSKSGCNAIQSVMAHLKSESYPVPRYLRLNAVGVSAEEAYPCGNPELMHKLQYLPDQIKNIKFYQPNENSSYEKVLAENLKRLRAVVRVSKVSML